MSVQLRDCVETEQVRNATVQRYRGEGSNECAEGCAETFEHLDRFVVVGTQRVCPACFRYLRRRAAAQECP